MGYGWFCSRFSIQSSVVGGYSCSPAKGKILFPSSQDSEANTFHKLLTTKLLPMPGTIRTCQKFLIQYNRRQLLILLQNCTDEGKGC